VENAGCASGQAIFIRTDTPDYAEMAVPFHSLEEMAALCTSRRPNLMLERLVVSHVGEKSANVLTLDCVSASNLPNRLADK
jgi:hypothetical protein